MRIIIFAFLSTVFLAFSSQGPDFNFYHTTDDINAKVIHLKDNCNGWISLHKINDKPMIHMLEINKSLTKQEKKHKAFLLFGEHAREMISPEAGLAFVERICNLAPEDTLLAKMLDKYHMRIILNANPASRIKVENGDYCLRVNENGVDLNRNWDAHWEKSGDEYSQTSSGESPFSEVETKALKHAVDEYKPLVFLTVHSGTMGMYTPYAYSDEKGVFNENKMMTVLGELNPKHCQCESGAAGKEVGYLCPGTCLDYAYDSLKVPYVFAWEIYQKGFDYSLLEAEQRLKFLQVNRKKRHQSAKTALFSCFIQTKLSSMNGLSRDECFDYFNPTTNESYKFVVNNWVDAMIDMLDSVDRQEVKK